MHRQNGGECSPLAMVRRMFSFCYGTENVLLSRRMFCSPFAMDTLEDVPKRNAENVLLWLTSGMRRMFSFAYSYGGGFATLALKRNAESVLLRLRNAENVLLWLTSGMRRMFSFAYSYGGGFATLALKRNAENVLLGL